MARSGRRRSQAASLVIIALAVLCGFACLGFVGGFAGNAKRQAAIARDASSNPDEMTPWERRWLKDMDEQAKEVKAKYDAEAPEREKAEQEQVKIAIGLFAFLIFAILVSFGPSLLGAVLGGGGSE